MRIVAKDRKKVVRFAGVDAHMMWTDLYNSCGLVNGDEEPDQANESGVLVGSIEVPHLTWQRVVAIIENEAGLCGPRSIEALKDPAEVSTLE